MSRSYRKPYVVDGYGGKHKPYAKRQANKRIRRSEGVPDGKQYRKFYETWNIRDYKSYYVQKPYVRRNYITHELSWVYPEDAWKDIRK